MRLNNVFYLLVAFMLFGGSPSQAESGKWGLGGFIDYNVPLNNLRDRYDSTTKYGATLNYVTSDALTVEIEYHHSKFDNGKLATDPWVYAVDGKSYVSPNATSELTFNSLAVNALIFLGDDNRSHGFKAKDYRYYLAVGGGFYSYKATNENFVFPAQNTEVLDLTLVMDPQIDQRTTIAGNVGTGLEAFVTDNLSLDVRGRYNFVVGELRPMLFYGRDRTRPMQFFDLGVGLKLYFWR
ncbi:MAG: outer membrane beta-barrel protein [bacterium]|nr:outer membrane beta-barrel protein [bacterium]